MGTDNRVGNADDLDSHAYQHTNRCTRDSDAHDNPDTEPDLYTSCPGYTSPDSYSHLLAGRHGLHTSRAIHHGLH